MREQEKVYWKSDRDRERDSSVWKRNTGKRSLPGLSPIGIAATGFCLAGVLHFFHAGCRVLVSLQGGWWYNCLLLGTVLFPSKMNVSLQGVAVAIGNGSVPTYDGCKVLVSRRCSASQGFRAKRLMFKLVPPTSQARSCELFACLISWLNFTSVSLAYISPKLQSHGSNYLLASSSGCPTRISNLLCLKRNSLSSSHPRPYLVLLRHFLSWSTALLLTHLYKPNKLECPSWLPLPNWRCLLNLSPPLHMCRPCLCAGLILSS